MVSRLSTVRHADEIPVLAKGKLIEQGTHDQLYAANGTYKLLAEKQLSWKGTAISKSRLQPEPSSPPQPPDPRPSVVPFLFH